MRLEDPLPIWFTYIAGMLRLVVGKNPQFLTTWTSPKDFLSVFDSLFL